MSRTVFDGGTDSSADDAESRGTLAAREAFTLVPDLVKPTRFHFGGLGHPEWDLARDGFLFTAPHSRTGYGVVGAHLLRALQARGVPVALRCLGPLDRRLTENPALDAAVELAATMASHAPSVRLSQQFDLLAHAGVGPRIGFTIFERDRFTSEELRHLRAQSAILVCSHWARQVCWDNGIEVPIHVVQLGVDRAVFHEHLEAPTEREETIFMQVGKLEARKGQLELLRAFEAAFTPRDPVRLFLHAHNPFIARSDFDALAAPFRNSPMRDRITVLDKELPTANDVAALMARAHCGVFPVRAEGWNLEALEMLSMGKTVIATDVTAHTEFLDERNALLVHVDRLEPALGGRLPGRWAAWGGTQHEQLVTHLRSVHTARLSGSIQRNDSGISTAKRFSWESSADALLRAIRTTVSVSL